MKTFTEIAISWTLMWGISYLIVAFIAPEISGTSALIGTLIYLVFGTAIIISLALRYRSNLAISYLARAMLFILAILEIYSGVASWSGVAMWNIPFANKELFQVSMAFADLLSAVFMIYLTISDD